MSWRKQLPLRLLVLAEAEDFLGIKEDGNNRGPAVEWFQKRGMINPGDPWCAAFVNAAAEIACAKKNVLSPLEKIPLQGYVQSYYDYALDHGWVLGDGRPGIGDLFLLWNAGLGRYAHIGFVSQVFAEGFSTVEGNSNTTGSRDGTEVVSNIRPYGSSTIFIDPWRDMI